MGTHSLEETLEFSCLPPFTIGINYFGKEFAPLGPNSLLEELNHFLEGFHRSGNHTESKKKWPSSQKWREK